MLLGMQSYSKLSVFAITFTNYYGTHIHPLFQAVVKQRYYTGAIK